MGYRNRDVKGNTAFVGVMVGSVIGGLGLLAGTVYLVVVVAKWAWGG